MARLDAAGAEKTNVSMVRVFGSRVSYRLSRILQCLGLHPGVRIACASRSRMLTLTERDSRTEKQQQTQSMLPLHLIPIRIDVDIQSFRPEPSFPLPSNPRDYGIDESHPAYRQPEPTPAYRLKDSFLWNLHEALITPDQFARVLVDELDFSHEKKMTLILEIAKQIREQLEQSAGVVLHPHFADSNGVNTHAPNVNGTHTSNTNGALSSGPQHNLQPITNGITSHAASSAPTPTTNGTAPHPPLQSPPKSFTATASQPVPSSDHQDHSPRRPLSPIHNPDDTHRCILTLSINLLNDLYTDRFEWSLLHPPGLAEHFARITAADLGLPGEWAAAIAHAIYEAVLRLKKEVLENGGQLLLYGEIDNDAAPTAATTSEADGTPAGFAQQSEAGWRYDPEHLGAFWAPRVEALSKEEIEKREGDRERQLRRARRERERYSTAILGPRESDFFGTGQDESVTLGRGERSKKKKRYRSLSPLGGDSPDPGQNAPGSGAGPGGTVPLGENERNPWRCSHCSIWGPAVWGVKEGPAGPKSLCPNCGMFWEKEGRLPVWNKGLFKDERGGWVGSSAAPIGTGLRR